VERDAGDDQPDAGQVADGRDLAEHDGPGERGEGGQQGEHERERGPGEPGHGELVGDVGDHGRAHPDAGSPGQPRGVAERGKGGVQAGRSGRGRGDEHRGAELVDPAEGLVPVQRRVRDLVTEHDIEHETRAVAEREHVAQRPGGHVDGGERGDPGNGKDKGREVAPAPVA